MSVTALPSWLAGRAPPGPRPRMRIQRDAKLRGFPFRRFTEEPHRHVTTPPDNVATIASIWRGFAPTTHHLGPHCRATMSPSRSMTLSPRLVGLRPDGALSFFRMAPRWHPSLSTSYLVASSPDSVGLGLGLAIGGAWWSFDYLPRLRPGWLVGLRPDPARAHAGELRLVHARPQRVIFRCERAAESCPAPFACAPPCPRYACACVCPVCCLLYMITCKHALKGGSRA